MDVTSDVTSKSNHHATKTDLTLLLECLKYQMDCPDSQKQALLTIYSICQQREENVDLFRNMGGVVFVYNLSKSSAHCEVKETALFTLGMLAENNVYCKQALCRKETFSDLADCLTQDCPLTLKRVAVYLLSVLVANNRSGQTFAQSSGCLDILLDLFRTRFPLSSEASAKPANIPQLHQLWKSVSSALCGCVNNPQNEESQMICVSAFPQIRVWLQQMALPRTELVQPICFFITMTVSNNNLAQESFSSMGGLETLTLTLIRVSSNATQTPLACELSCIMAKTLSACISDNPALASGLARHRVVEQLLPLLTSPNVDPREQLSVILALGHCTEACEEHQSQLVQCGGLSVIISVLTDAHNEEVRKAATFLLHTCKQAISVRGPALGRAHGQARQGQAGQVNTPEDLEACWRSATEMLHKIKQFEREQAKRRYEEERETPDQQTLEKWLAEAIPSPLSPPLMSHPAPVPQWVGRAQGGEPGRGKRNHGERERGRPGERTPVPTAGEQSDREGGGRERGGRERGGRERGGRRFEERREDMTPCRPMTERRGRPDLKEDQREGRQHRGDTEPNSGKRVRRQIFQAGVQPHEALSKERGRPPTHSHSSQRRGNDSGLSVTSAQTEAQTEAGARAERPTERDTQSSTQSGRERGRGWERERLSSYLKPSASHVRTHTLAEHYGMAEPTRTHATSAPTAHAAAGNLGQPPVDRDERCSVCRGTGTAVTPSSPPLEGARKTDIDSLVFKLPLPAKPRAPPRPKNWIDDEDVLSLCSELLDSEINKILETPEPAHKPSTHRCSGCVLRFSEVSSRTFPGLQRSCHHICDLHAALLEASDRHRQHLPHGLPKAGRQEHAPTPTASPRRRDTLRYWEHCTDIRLTPIRIGGLQRSQSTQGGEHRAGRYSHVSLTPLKKPVPSDDKVAHMHAHTHTHSCSVVSTPDQKTHHGGDSAIDEQQTHLSMQECPMTKRDRKNFSHEELCYLLSGVKKFGPSWNSILWAYPFHPGRNNVDLAMKYRRLQIRGRVQDVTYPRDPGATHS
ncbi:telomere repeats-binding bouquet formation protein 1 isoform X2 [Osmerus eperlanus]|uniref:telomere repeats-binding bouquet formation protein 1 isoform X2 n=1 Tax=Osmerus eperlanus TaxID=29151 RepID=UPI002E1047F5